MVAVATRHGVYTNLKSFSRSRARSKQSACIVHQRLRFYSAMMMRVRRRHVMKGPDPNRLTQESQSSPPELDAEDGSAKRQVYLITFPHPRIAAGRGGAPTVAPGTLSHEELLTRVLEACAAPISASPNPSAVSHHVALSTAAVFREFHKAEGADQPCCHYHVAVKAGTCFRFAPVKKALQEKFGLASHWSCTHTGYWSPVKYCAVPSPKKTRSMLDPRPLLWSRAGAHPSLHMCCHEPQTASAMRAKRQMKEDASAEASRAEPRVTEYDLWPIVVESQIRSTPDDRNAHLRLMQYVKSHCSQAVCAFVFKNRARLPGLIEDIWRWEMVDDVLAAAVEPLIQSLRNAAAMPCVCGAHGPGTRRTPWGSTTSTQQQCARQSSTLSWRAAPLQRHWLHSLDALEVRVSPSS